VVPLKLRCSPVRWQPRPYSTCSGTAGSASRSMCSPRGRQRLCTVAGRRDCARASEEDPPRNGGSSNWLHSGCTGVATAGAFRESMHSKVVREENHPVLSRSSFIGRWGNLAARDDNCVLLTIEEVTGQPLVLRPREREVVGVVVVLANDASRFARFELEPPLQSSASTKNLAVTQKIV